METNRFFRVVWRLNAIVILVAGVLAVGLLTLAATQFAKDVFGPRRGYGTATIAEETSTEVAWRLGHLSAHEGGSYLVAPLWADQSSDRAYFSKSETSTRNLLFLNGQTNASHWLFRDHEQLIIEHISLKDGCDQSSPRIVRAVLLDVVRVDTDGDDRWTASDHHEIGVSRPDGRAYSEIATGVKRLLGHRLVGEDVLVVVFERDNAVHSVRVSLSDFAVLDEATIPMVV